MMTKKKSKLKWAAAGAAAVLIAALLAGAFLLGRRPARRGDDIRTAAAERGTISTVVTGAGVLEGQRAETVSVPAGVEIGELLVSAGDRVDEGEALAVPDPGSVREALDALGDRIGALDARLEGLPGAAAGPEHIAAGVSGRVKVLWAAPGDDAAEVTLRCGGVALLSLDGKMELVLPPSDGVKTGDGVTVTLSDGSVVPGTVEESGSGRLVIALSDDGPAPGETASAAAADGTELGAGTLAVRRPLAVTAGRGTVAAVTAEVNGLVAAGDPIFELAGAETDREYEDLLRQRGELTEELAELLRLERTGTVAAPFAGTVMSAGGSPAALCALSPDGAMTLSVSVDELDVLSIAPGQAVSVTVSALGDGPFSGTVTAVSAVGSSLSGVTRFAVEITLPRSAGMLPGMTASAEIVVRVSENCLTLPEEALNQSGAVTFVYTAWDPETGELSGEIPVTTGVSDGVRVEITGGLAEGDTVCYRLPEAEESGGISSWEDWEDMTPWEDTNPFGGRGGGGS